MPAEVGSRAPEAEDVGSGGGSGGGFGGARHETGSHETWGHDTVGAALRRGTLHLVDSPSARLDAELLLAHASGIGRSAVLAGTDEVLEPAVAAEYDDALRRRALGEPVAYITGCAYFHSLSLDVTPDVLVPRPESEMLVEWALDRLTHRHGMARVVDVGTGSGAIALAIASGAGPTTADLHATDTSAAALAVARANAERLDLADRVTWHLADLLPDLLPDLQPDAEQEFDIVVANLPYVGESERGDVEPGVMAFEPHEALFAGADGLSQVRRLLRALPRRLASEGAAAIEIGWLQGDSVVRLARDAFPEGRVRLLQDLAGHDRVVVIDTADGSESDPWV